MLVGRFWLASGIALCAGASAAVGCAFDLPNQLLANREETLKAPLANSFSYEVKQLAGPLADTFTALDSGGTYQSPVSHNIYFGADAESQRKADAERKGLTETEAELASRLKGMKSGQAVLDAPGEMSEEVRLYEAGAADFHGGQMESAAQRFQAVLALPIDRRQLRSADAAYSLGRAEAAIGDDDKAVQAFELVRRLARGGADDPDDLAVASYGEEARIHYRRAKEMLANSVPDGADLLDYGREIDLAIGLYAQQAARNSESGVSSLRIVAQGLMCDKSTVLAAAEFPSAQKLMVALVLARFLDNIPDPNDPAEAESDDASAETRDDAPARTAICSYASMLPASELVATLAEASDKHGEGWLANSDRLAALAYRDGNYGVASHLLAKTTGPLAAWLKAKLALQRGDLSAAAALYSDAAKSFPANGDENPLDPDNRALLSGETGALTLARGDYVTALGFLYAAKNYWADVAYVAERVLAADELKAFVDSKVPQNEPEASGSAQGNLRTLLARRLMRLGRFREAFAYFQDAKIRQQAMDYAQALEQAKGGWLPIGRAEAWYKAASLARYSGMELLGYEGPPDYAIWDGEFQIPVGPEAKTLSGAWVSRDEPRRVAQSQSEPDKRFHYRYIAADYAAKAADLLPSRSQAFAAVLCRGTGWLLSVNDDDGAGDLYGEYVKKGALVPWATHFGHDCPEPDFAGAPKALERQIEIEVHYFVSKQRWAILAALVAIAGLSFYVWSRRNRNA